MRKIFQKYRILKPSEGFLTITLIFKPIQSRDVLKQLPPPFPLKTLRR